MKQLREYQKQAINETWEALKKNDEPVLLMASVGAGKSLMLARILLKMEMSGKRALCLVNNAELVRNNCETYINQAGRASIYCAALNSKDISKAIIFGTPQTVLNSINKKEPISKIQFNLIVVDEAHAINFNNHRSGFMRILRYYKQQYPCMRLLGATGTNYRFKGASIVGESGLFKTQTGNVTTESLIDRGYLVKPSFKIDKNMVIDFSKVKIKQNGLFDNKGLELVVSKNARLSELICKQIVYIMRTQNRYGVFIFATTKKHAIEIMSYLPQNESALILGETKHNERTEIFEKARAGKIKYLVNISIISVGVDIPAFDTVAYLRPTESLVLLVQTMGRALRLSESTGKNSALVLDFAGNIERHKDWDNPLIIDAIKQTEDDEKPKLIVCPRCNEKNTDTARRCIGLNHNKRCDYYFEFKECPNENCKVKNDIAARHCHTCQTEIIDPNKKLTLNVNTENKNKELIKYCVINAHYALSDSKNGYRVTCAYTCKNEGESIKKFFEFFVPSSDKAKHVFYGQFIKKHCKNTSFWYNHISDRKKMEEMLKTAEHPIFIYVVKENEYYKIKKKEFN